MDEFEQEWAKMLEGKIYDAVHPEFLRRLEATRQRIWEFNNLNPAKVDEMKTIFRSIVGKCGEAILTNLLYR